MHYMIMVIVEDINQCPTIFDAWEAAGSRGVTILDSTGIGRLRKHMDVHELPIMPTLRTLLRTREEHHRTMFTVVEEDMVDRIIDATNQVIDVEQPDTGIIFVLPVARVIGMAPPRDEDNSAE